MYNTAIISIFNLFLGYQDLVILGLIVGVGVIYIYIYMCVYSSSSIISKICADLKRILLFSDMVQKY